MRMSLTASPVFFGVHWIMSMLSVAPFSTSGSAGRYMPPMWLATAVMSALVLYADLAASEVGHRVVMKRPTCFGPRIRIPIHRRDVPSGMSTNLLCSMTPL